MGGPSLDSPGGQQSSFKDINLKNYSDVDLEITAELIATQAATGVTADSIVDSLKYMQEKGIKLNQKTLDALEAGTPILPPPNPSQTTSSFTVYSDGGSKVNKQVQDTQLNQDKTTEDDGTGSGAVKGNNVNRNVVTDPHLNKTGGSGEVGGTNPWFGSNPLVTILQEYFLLIQLMQKMELANNKIAIGAMNAVWDMSKNAAQAIKDSANKEAMQHYIQAAAAGIGMVLSVATAAKSGWETHKAGKNVDAEDEATQEKINAKQNQLNKAKIEFGEASGEHNKAQTSNDQTKIKALEEKKQAKKIEKEKLQDELDNMKSNQKAELAQRTSRIAQQAQHATVISNAVLQALQHGTDMTKEILTGLTVVEKAKFDGLLQMYQGYKTIQQSVMEHSFESQKKSEDWIAQTLQQIQKISDETMRSFGVRPH